MAVLHQRLLALEQDHARLLEQYAAVKQQLRDKETLLTYIIKHVPNALAVFDHNMRYLLASDRFLTAYNVADQDVIGRSHYEVFPEIPQTWKDVYQRSLAGAIEQATDDAFVRADGTITYNRWECRPWYDAHGTIGGIMFFTEVITERKQLEEQLRLSQERLQFTLAGSGDGAWDWHIPTGEMVFSDRYHELLGYEPGTLVNHVETWVNAVHPNDLPRVNGILQHYLKGQRATYEAEHRLKHASGEWRWILIRGKVVVTGERGKPLRMSGTITDITERKQAEDDLRLFKTLVEKSPSAIRIANRDGILTYTNTAYQHLFGYPTSMVGMHVSVLYSPEEAERLITRVHHLAETGVLDEIITLQRADGSTFPAHCIMYAVYSPDGQFDASAAIIRDLTIERQAEAEQTALQQQVIDAQRTALRELSTPLIPITDTIVVMPLIGTLDDTRVQQVMETLLPGVAHHQAQLAIVDITGITVIDEQTVQGLVQAAQAVRLLGAQAMLTGINPQVAQTLVQLGSDLTGIITHATLQAGMTRALLFNSRNQKNGR